MSSCFKLNNWEKSCLLMNEAGRKTNKYFQRTNDGKQILREMMSKYIPRNIIEAKKQGFSSPDASRFKGESIDFVQSSLLNDQAKIYDIWISPQLCLSLRNISMESKSSSVNLVLLNIEAWMSEYL